jgi:amino acid transporter
LLLKLIICKDLGTAIPRSGGERVYLERIFRKPRMLATCMFMAYVVLLGFSTPNAIVLGDYTLYALDADPDENQWAVRGMAVVVVSTLCWIHAKHPRLGLRLINILGFAKMLIIVAVVLAGIAGGLMGIGGHSDLWKLRARRLDLPMSELTTARRNFANIWAGSSTQPYDYATALLKVIYCFRGYSTANQVVSSLHNPTRTLRVAAPIALGLISLAYLAINAAFFLVVEKEDFKSAGVVVAGLFFRNVFGDGVGAHVLPLAVIVSAAGNIAATAYAQARVNEELARDGLLPFSRFWTTEERTSPPTSPADKVRLGLDGSATAAPAKGLLLHWAVSVAAIVLPPGHIYAFLVDVGGYPVGVISTAVSLGLLYLHLSPAERWTSPCRANLACVVVFALANALLLILPWIPPSGSRGEGGGGEAGTGFPFYAYPATAMALLGSGAVYWCYWQFWGNGRSPAKAQGNRRTWSRNDERVDEAHLAKRLVGPDDEDAAAAGSGLGLGRRRRAKCGCPLAG